MERTLDVGVSIMKTHLLFALIVVGLFSLGVAGQVRTLSRVEFDKAMDAAFTATAAKSRREVETSTTYERGKVTQTSKTTREFLPPDRTRYLFEDTLFGKKSTDEWITIGEDRYKKDAAGKWFLADQIRTIRGSTDADPEAERRTSYTSAPSPFPGKAVTILTRVEKGAPDSTMVSATFIMYIAKDGLIMSTERTSVEVGKGNYKKEITMYTYDVMNLKIEAPIK